MIARPEAVRLVGEALRRSPVAALLGPRQCGKTTLAKAVGRSRASTYFDLEAPSDRLRLQNPEFILRSLRGLVILDEIQAMPELFNILRVLADRRPRWARFLILGSAAPEVVRSVSETLAGRVDFVELGGFDLSETGPSNWRKLWLRGGFPGSFLARTESDSMAWRAGFVRTFLERDIPQLGISIPAAALRRFWTMLSHYHGQVWNASRLGTSLGLSDKTIRSYLDLLTGTYIFRQLLPWYENVGKRQVKSCKVYFRDAGLYHHFLGTGDARALFGHPQVGASWEGFALEQTISALRPDDAYFWATHNGAELDLLMLRRGRRVGVEFKFDDAPAITRSMRIAIETLRLDRLWIVYPGDHFGPLDKTISLCPVARIGEMA